MSFPGDITRAATDNSSFPAPVDAVKAAAFNGVDITAYYTGAPTASLVGVRRIFTRAFNFPANFAGSQAKALVAATALTTFNIQKNGATVASFAFGAAATVATFSTQAAVSFAAGDILTIVAPGTPDATLANIAVALLGYYF